MIDRGDKIEDIMNYVDQTVLPLAPDAQKSGPGDAYKPIKWTQHMLGILKIINGATSSPNQATNNSQNPTASSKENPKTASMPTSGEQTKKSSLDLQVVMNPGTFDKQRASYKISGPTPVAQHDFRDGIGLAKKYDVEIDGKKTSVFMPTNQNQSLRYHSIEEVAKGLAAIPQSNRNLITNVNVEQNKNPDDAFWAQQYNDNSFTSYMTSGATGEVCIYPGPTKMSQEYMDGTFVHETAHTLSQQKWGQDSSVDPRWQDWNAAMSTDKLCASEYAKNSPDEDFAETMLLYVQSKGAPAEAELRQLMPERYKILDAISSEKR